MRILHFVTGGFSGATQVVVDLVTAHNEIPNTENLLVLRRKKTTVPEKLAGLEAKNIDCRVVTGVTHISTIYELKKLCEQWKPDVFVAHGFPEHLLGRQACLWAKHANPSNPPKIVQVEHNSREAYTPWKRYNSRRLSKSTDAVIAVSQGVADVLSAQHLQAPIHVIANGIDCSRFGSQYMPPIASRPQDLIMVGRYAKSKDHVTLIKAMHELKKKGVTPNLTLVGSGRKRYKKEVERLIINYELTSQVNLIEYSNEVDKLLLENKVFVMSSRFEGLNLAVLEAMASGCVVVGSRAVGVEELIKDTHDGFLFDIGDEVALAMLIEAILSSPENYQPLAISAREKVLNSYNKSRMMQDYHDLISRLI